MTPIAALRGDSDEDEEEERKKLLNRVHAAPLPAVHTPQQQTHDKILKPNHNYFTVDTKKKIYDPQKYTLNPKH